MRTKEPRPFGWWWNIFKQRFSPEELTFCEHEEVFFDPYRGFIFWMVTDDKDIFVTKGCGDGRYWRDLVFKMGESMPECKNIIVHSRRNRNAYARLFQAEEVTELGDGLVEFRKEMRHDSK